LHSADHLPELIEIACADENTAREQAAHQQAREEAGAMEWIYLRNRSGQWVARRVPKNPPPESERKSRAKRVIDALVNYPNWFG
jgi:hypothetical protein